LVIGALAFFRRPCVWRERISILIDVLNNVREEPGNRATAAEGLGYTKPDKRTTIFRKAVSSLILALNDPWPDVRGCAAFALGNLEAKEALPALGSLARYDREEYCGMGEIRKAARSAIKRIRRGACAGTMSLTLS
jgi:HEAT repeat protein